MAPTSKQLSSSSRSKRSKDQKQSANTVQWMDQQAVDGPWDPIDGVESEWPAPDAGSVSFDAASVQASQGSAKHKSQKHKSSSKK
ncbi:hypothetical protein TruAng_008949 [Truncatella angustata]|nr:hypothetical protein TruAng_008949 [Truncatella angustata]